jgi:hypothetical protein
MRTALEGMALAFADRGAALAGRPATAAFAMAQLEYVTETLPVDPRYTQLAPGVARELVLARSELRDALGAAPAASSSVMTIALLDVAGRLRAGDLAGAARSMPAPLFQPGGAESVARLSELGPLPQAMVATIFARDAVGRLDAEALAGSTTLPSTGAGWQALATPGGAVLSAGY